MDKGLYYLTPSVHPKAVRPRVHGEDDMPSSLSINACKALSDIFKFFSLLPKPLACALRSQQTWIQGDIHTPATLRPM
jgi:hypothetical protein